MEAVSGPRLGNTGQKSVKLSLCEVSTVETDQVEKCYRSIQKVLIFVGLQKDLVLKTPPAPARIRLSWCLLVIALVSHFVIPHLRSVRRKFNIGACHANITAMLAWSNNGKYTQNMKGSVHMRNTFHSQTIWMIFRETISLPTASDVSQAMLVGVNRKINECCNILANDPRVGGARDGRAKLNAMLNMAARLKFSTETRQTTVPAMHNVKEVRTDDVILLSMLVERRNARATI